MATDYTNMTNDEFDEILLEVLMDANMGEVIRIPGVYELVSEHYNNDVLLIWKVRKEEKQLEEGGNDDD